ncbi:hypothetical protein GNP09_12995 [Escherichia coli]|nr:hypothetical protein [Escherichia coli]
MRNLAQQKRRPGAGLRLRAVLSGHDQDRAALAHINSLPRRSGTQYSGAG